MFVKIKDMIVTLILKLAAVLVVGILVWFLYMVLAQGLPVLNKEFLLGMPKEMEEGGGIGPELFNTFYILVLSLIFTIPVGIGAGIYLAEYAKDNIITRMIRLSIETLASVPSIVFGLFGMVIFVIKFKFGFSILGGALTLSIVNLPVVVSVTETALREVPQTYKEASLALGTTKWQTIMSIMLPTAFHKIINGIKLAVGRAIGESAVLIFTAGTSISRNYPEFNPLSSGETLSVHLWYVKSIGLVPDAERIAAGSSAVLIILVLVINVFMNFYEKRLRLKFLGVK
ncbi:phosphate ABC transporter permease PstA [Thermobrachium celere]|uniref:Phosphate transport system permease protein PstA n=1 Tax=Thermobrachium celere DSM 8682 TaxID=941824 RepID=R7RPG9_9CLOT|nr:phosphate ABC transporter permease PstA [Thermobrachium celere]CDF57271.1 Phosphate transport system permease protein PstA (TC 3.A.1.7.1) [Thermobrachium celere DSM 8682]